MSTDAADATPAYRYTAELAGEIERRWQQHWEEQGTFHAPNPVGPLKGDVPADKLFVQDMFPYPSGSGLHVGHPLGFIGTDVFARYHRMNGRNVLHTMGFDAFGLPAEQYAVQTGQHPRKTTEDNIQTYLRQIRRLGLGHDERRRISTIDPGYYKWTQWIFLQIFNSWYDPAAGKARPITELEAQFASGERATPDKPWAEMSRPEREKLLGQYRLVYLSEAPVNWCPGLGTVLANEEVTADGRSERGNFPVFRRSLRQWMMRITAYSDRLVDDLDRLDWPDKIKAMQRNWIGRSHGARVRFAVTGHDGVDVEVFTTRPDTLFGATYMVLAPEHPLVDVIASAEQAGAIAAYRAEVSRKSELDRQENKVKTGVFTGAHATNPVNGAQIPVYIADYVLMGYGTGAIMAVPGQDQRDWDFAKAFDLPIIRTVQPPEDFDGEAYTGTGPAVNSSHESSVSLDGLDVDEAKKKIIAWLEEQGRGEGTVQFKLRDWLFSRQRYWGEPFPIVYDEDGTPIAVPESMLPIELPDVDDYSPRTFDPEDADSEPSPPLSRAGDWVTVELDLGDGPREYRRETNTMPNWAGSCWYQLRYVDPSETERFVNPENERYWLGPRTAEHGATDPGGVDLYIGGVEHAVLHLLYARFWQKVLFDLGHVSGDEPYRRLFNQGYIEAYAYRDSRGTPVPAEQVEERDGKYFFEGEEVRREYGKMGKSLRNVVTPDDMCEKYGADTFRLYEMSMGPMDVSRPWATKDVVGAQRFLQRLWRNLVDETTGELRVTDEDPGEDALRLLHKTIAGVHDDFANLRYNTAGAKLIELNNHVTKHFPGGAPRALAEPLAQMLAPLSPHVAEELWAKLGHGESLAHGPFPAAEEKYLVEDTVEYPIQVNGKVKARVVVSASASADEVQAAALADEKVAELLNGGTPRKVIVVPGRLVNVVL
ncbi:leucyl-tRNA synthetase [Saccharothrix sp. NRRL B-16348]|uniref:leucine--tRNA ligase n=1 Tax=Saccharothrix sp. NRRL B-16348 TaxID=1415542 RepID=UPI0006ADC34F|nr:leucine--tRNA ligase [Saccharothrix sp. NRRL B-16348]KOX35377.1 leucyl-tRNA synthetase [Saccharothrix sp. NRRL B-16348]